VREDLERLYFKMLEERVVPTDFIHYKEDDFVDFDDDNLDYKYNAVTPNLDKMTLKDYNKKQIESLKRYFRNKMNIHGDVSESEIMEFIKKLIANRPEVMMKTRLHLAALEPELFKYTR